VGFFLLTASYQIQIKCSCTSQKKQQNEQTTSSLHDSRNQQESKSVQLCGGWRFHIHNPSSLLQPETHWLWCSRHRLVGWLRLYAMHARSLSVFLTPPFSLLVWSVCLPSLFLRYVFKVTSRLIRSVLFFTVLDFFLPQQFLIGGGVW